MPALLVSPHWAPDGGGAFVSLDDLQILLALIGLAAAYVLGARSDREPARSKRQGLLFGGAWLILALALVSPVHTLAERSVFAHMVQHMLLIIVVPILLVYAGVGRVGLAWPLSSIRVTGTAPAAGHPAVAVPLHVMILWAWHVPVLYEGAVHHSVVHGVEHVTLLGSALLFWSGVIDHREHPLRAGAACIAVGAAGALLGSLMALSGSAWYATPNPEQALGLNPFEDQQLAGLVMWVPGGLVYLAVAALRVAETIMRGESEEALATKPGGPLTLPRG